jgi:hypothetical protein
MCSLDLLCPFGLLFIHCRSGSHTDRNLSCRKPACRYRWVRGLAGFRERAGVY